MSELCPICKSEIKDGEAVCTTCGFKLLGSTQEFQPVGNQQVAHNQVEVTPLPTVPEDKSYPSFTIVHGPQIGTIYQLDKELNAIGRDPKCEIFLNDMTVSREHALVTVSDKGTIIADSNSFNGIWVNNESIEQGVLNDGDIIQIGAFCLEFAAEGNVSKSE